jgi:hypothetical protein
MNRYNGTLTALTIAFNRDVYLAIKVDRHEGPHPTLTIALHGGI